MNLLFPSLPGTGDPASKLGVWWLNLLVVAALHAGALALLLIVVPAERIAELVRPLSVRLIEEPAARPVAPPPAEPPRPRPKAPPRILAVEIPASTPGPASFVISQPPPDPAPASAVPPAPTFAPVAEPLVAARFDAAYLNNPKPMYPMASRRLGEEGRVVLRVLVDAQGRAEAVELERSSGFPRLDTAAREAVVQWRFVPARRGSEPVPARVLVPIVFNLEG
jgi:protein TonB